MKTTYPETSVQVLEIKEMRKATDVQLAQLLGISKMSLYTRVRDHKWRKADRFYINYLFNNPTKL